MSDEFFSPEEIKQIRDFCEKHHLPLPPFIASTPAEALPLEAPKATRKPPKMRKAG